REARPFEEIENRRGNFSKTPARVARRLEILAALLRMLLQIFGRVASHERKVERPAGLSRDRHPDQLAFEKKSNERGVPVKRAKEREDVDPRNVIADDEVVAVVAKSVDAFDVPLGREHPIEDPVVAGDPMLREF